MELKQDVKDKIDNAATKKLIIWILPEYRRLKILPLGMLLLIVELLKKYKVETLLSSLMETISKSLKLERTSLSLLRKMFTFDSVTINNGPKLSSTGIDAVTRKYLTWLMVLLITMQLT